MSFFVVLSFAVFVLSVFYDRIEKNNLSTDVGLNDICRWLVFPVLIKHLLQCRTLSFGVNKAVFCRVKTCFLWIKACAFVCFWRFVFAHFSLLWRNAL